MKKSLKRAYTLSVLKCCTAQTPKLTTIAIYLFLNQYSLSASHSPNTLLNVDGILNTKANIIFAPLWGK